MKPYKILYKFPSRSRPHKFFSCVDDINRLSESKEYKIVATLDVDDSTMNNSEVRWAAQGYENLELMYGTSTGKINAINRDMESIDYPWDIVVVFSDDMKLLKKSFDNVIRAAFVKHGLDSIIHFHDGPYGSRLMGLNVQGRKNFERFNYLYNPEYVSLFCDNEQKSVGEIIGNYHYMGDGCKWIEHLHPAHTPGAVADELLTKTESYYKQDEQTYLARKARNFDL